MHFKNNQNLDLKCWVFYDFLHREWWYSSDSHNYRQSINIRRTLVGNQIHDHSDVAGASPVGVAPSTSSFSTLQPASVD